MGSTSKEEQARVRSLLLDTVSLLCKNGLTHKTMKIQGLLGITINDDDVFIVHINDLVGQSETDAGKRTSERSASRESSSGKSSDKNTNRKRSSTSSPASKGPPDKRNREEVIIVDDERRRQMHDNRPIITNIRGGHTPQKHPGMRGPMMGSPNRMPFVRVIGSPNQRGGMLSPQRMMGQRGRPPMHAFRCQYCPGVFQNQQTYFQHAREIHPNMPQPNFGQVRPVGPPGVGMVRRNLYSGQPPLVARKNRHENNSDAPIDIDASPPPAKSTTDDPVSPNTLGDSPASVPAGQNETSDNGNQNQVASTVKSPASSQNDSTLQTENADGEKTSSEKSESGSRPDSRAGSRAGSRPGSRAGSRTGSIVNKSAGSDGSDTEGYSPPSPCKSVTELSSSSEKPNNGQQSVVVGVTETEATGVLTPAQQSPKTATKEFASVSQNISTPANTINIAPLQGSSEPPNIFEQLESTFDTQSLKTSEDVKIIHTTNDPSKDDPPSLSPQPKSGAVADTPPSTVNRDGPPPLTPLQQNVAARTFEIKPEGPFGSEIFGGQQVYETQNTNRPVVTINQPGQFPGPNNMTPHGTTITVAPNPQGPPFPPNIQQFPPPHHQQQAPPTMPMQGMPPQFMQQNPYAPPQQHPGPPPFGGPGGPGFNGFF